MDYTLVVPELCQERVLPKPCSWPSLYGESEGELHRLGYSLSKLGQFEDAALPMREAVELRKGLASSDATEFNEDLAESLDQLVDILTKLGRIEEATKIKEEAADVVRRRSALLVIEGRS